MSGHARINATAEIIGNNAAVTTRLSGSGWPEVHSNRNISVLKFTSEAKANASRIAGGQSMLVRFRMARVSNKRIRNTKGLATRGSSISCHRMKSPMRNMTSTATTFKTGATPPDPQGKHEPTYENQPSAHWPHRRAV
jgi:hypothetical protein